MLLLWITIVHCMLGTFKWLLWLNRKSSLEQRQIICWRRISCWLNIWWNWWCVLAISYFRQLHWGRRSATQIVMFTDSQRVYMSGLGCVHTVRLCVMHLVINLVNHCWAEQSFCSSVYVTLTKCILATLGQCKSVMQHQ